MRVMIGVLLAVVAALAWTGWSLHGARSDLAVAKSQAAMFQTELERQVQAGALLEQRLANLDQSLTRLHETTEIHTRQLGLTLAGIDRIELTEGDSDASVECLDVRVPGELDGWLR